MNKSNLLDHGYLALIETWGSDERIVETARMSTGKGFLGWEAGECPVCNGSGVRAAESATQTTSAVIDCHACEGKGTHRGDSKLLAYLYNHGHATPFECAGMTLEVQAPIMVFREWHRHRTQSYSELSARYTPMPDLNYVPTTERLMRNVGGTNKQAGVLKGSVQLSLSAAEDFRISLTNHYSRCQALYEEALQAGIPKELARVHLPVGRYSRMRASANLRNWLAFLTLRMDPSAQEEIRVYANEVAKLIEQKFPRTYELFVSRKESNK